MNLALLGLVQLGLGLHRHRERRVDAGEPRPLAAAAARLADHLRGLRGADVSGRPDHGGEGAGGEPEAGGREAELLHLPGRAG